MEEYSNLGFYGGKRISLNYKVLSSILKSHQGSHSSFTISVAA